MKKYFGTDGIRGIPGESLKEEIVTKIFSSVEKILAPKSVAIILDTRESCEMITEWIVKGFSEEVSITNYGILPSGSMPILLETFNEDLGIIISASHNPSEYNGIKLIDKNGSKLDDDLEIQIESELERVSLPENNAKIKNSTKGYDIYLQYLKNVNDFKFDKFDLIIDAANGSAFKIIEDLLSAKNAQFNIISNNPDGKNINDNCGATFPENLQKNISNGQVGISFDGDADRLIMVDENQQVVNGDLLLTILSKYLSEKGNLNGDFVVSTVMSNYGFKLAMNDFGFKLIETPVGDKYVAEAMKKNNAKLGGEQSGHIILGDFLPVGDALLTCLLVLEALDYFDVSIADFREKYLMEYPQKLTNIELSKSLNDEELEFINQIALEMSIKLDLDGRYLQLTGGTMDGNIIFPDNIKALFGTGSDMEMYYDGSKGIIDNRAGAMQIRSASELSLMKGSSETMATFIPDGAVTLNYDNALKFETKSDGAKVTGNLTVTGTISGTMSGYLALSGGTMTGTTNHNDNVQSIWGASSDLRIYHNAVQNNGIIQDTSSNGLEIYASTDVRIAAGVLGETYALFTGNGSIELYYNGSKKFETLNGGTKTTGAHQITGNLQASGSEIDFESSTNLLLGANTQIEVDGDPGSSGQYLKSMGNGNGVQWASLPSSTTTQTILFCNFSDDTSTTSGLRIPFNTLNETTSNQLYFSLWM